MGQGLCCRSQSERDLIEGGFIEKSKLHDTSGTLPIIFSRFDKDDKGYISLEDLKKMMRDDKTHFQGKDAIDIMEKYGTNGKMTFAQFETWWTSTYTSYSDDAVAKLVQEVHDEEHGPGHGGGSIRRIEHNHSQRHWLDTIQETEPLSPVPENSNVAISRS